MIDFIRSLGNADTTWAIVIELLKIHPEYKSIKPRSLLKVVYKFLKRFRSASHINSNNAEDLIFYF